MGSFMYRPPNRLQTGSIHREKQQLMKRFRAPVLTSTLFCIVIVLASIFRAAADLNGPVGFAFFLLILISLFALGIGAAMTAWELMDRFLPQSFGIPERLLLAVATFIVTCGCGPLAITLAVKDSIGATGTWALIGILLGSLLCCVAILVFVVRLALYGGQPKHS